MREFHVGDKVWCNRKGYYRITSYHVPCIVLASVKGFFTVAVIAPPMKLHRNGFAVNPMFFEPIEEEIEWV